HIPVYAHRMEEEMLLDASLNMSINYRPCSIKADVLLEEGQEIEVAGFTFIVYHTPGHTRGSCCYYLKEEDILLSGDTLFCGSVGRTDFPGGSTSDIINSLHRLLRELPEETKVYPGHESETTIGYEKRYNPFV
ncbi:MAG: MBL fold metallo-hydrolase, partial [Blautia sp.]|nr:MBL fold metallo-hydrolase [Blautia sp.]